VSTLGHVEVNMARKKKSWSGKRALVVLALLGVVGLVLWAAR
jgi:hypothetical protein